MDFSNLTVSGFAAFILTLLLMQLALKLAPLIDAVDLPDERKIHLEPIPQLGGLAFTIAFSICVFLFLEIDARLKYFLLGLAVIFMVGFYDDIFQSSYRIKFAGQIIAALIFILGGEIMLDNFGDLVGIGPLKTGFLAVPITLFCMVGVINAINLVDGLDGLAGGLSVIASLFLVYFTIVSGHSLYLTLLVILIGCVIGRYALRS